MDVRVVLLVLVCLFIIVNLGGCNFEVCYDTSGRDCQHVREPAGCQPEGR